VFFGCFGWWLWYYGGGVLGSLFLFFFLVRMELFVFLVLWVWFKTTLIMYLKIYMIFEFVRRVLLLFCNPLAFPIGSSLRCPRGSP